MAEREEIDWLKIAIIVLLLAVLISLIFITYTKNCRDNVACFKKETTSCSRAVGNLYIADNFEQFKVIGKHGDYCRITVYMITPSKNFNEGVQAFLKGKGMVCEIPQKEISQKAVSEVPNLNDYCSGPLKESILQVSVDSLYEIIVRNLGVEALASYNAEFGK